jgi:aminoglycoside 2'-N-acetyltransferase I
MSASVAVRRTEELTAADRSSVIDLCIAAHENDDFQNLFTHFASGARHFLTYRGQDLVSHAMVSTRWLQLASRPLMRTAYVDAVSTLPSAQGLGYGTATMRRLAATIDDYEIGCLQTDIRGFYEPLGWELWRGALAGRDEDQLIPTPDQRGVMVLPLRRTPSIDLDAPLSIEVQSYRIWE